MSLEVSRINKCDEKRGYLFLSLVLLLGLILRIILSSYGTYDPDFGTWRAWAYGIYHTGFHEFYSKIWCDYMPGYIYILWILQLVHENFKDIHYEILFKLPANLSDLGISVLIFFALKKITTIKVAFLSSVIYFYNPASLSNSTFWGQVDSVHTLPILLSVYMVLNGRYILSGIFVSCAFMIKPQSLVVFPILGILTLENIVMKQQTEKSINLIPSFKFLFAVLITIFLVTLPFIFYKIDSVFSLFTEPVIFIYDRFKGAYSQYNIASLNAFNFWGMVAMWRSDQTEFLGITYQRWGTLVLALLYTTVIGFIFGLMIKRRSLVSTEFDYRVFQGVTLILFALFLFVTRAHERHLLPTIAFFTIIAFKNWIFWFSYGLTSLVYVINMFYAYLELTMRNVPPSVYLSLIKEFIFGLVILLIIIFLILLVDVLKTFSVIYQKQETIFKKGE